MMKKGFMTTLLLVPAPLTFQAHGFSCFSIIPQKSKSPAGTTLRLTDKKSDDAAQSPLWTLDEDWLLVDQLPKFTVGAGDQTRTFWTQLSAATPRLSSKGIPELLERCHVLQTNYTLHYGPSPPLLQNWGVDLSSVSSSSSSSSSSENNRAVGTLEDGRVVFLNYHVVGRLAGDSFQETTATAAAASPDLMAQIPGGYLEAVGGRIYELGEPRKSPGAVVVTREKPDSFRLPFGSSSILDSDESTSGPISARDVAWWLPSATSTISTMLAAAILSACIGYGAGLGIQGNSAAGGGGAAPTPATEDIQVLHAKFSSSFSSSSSSTSPTDSGLSLEERKERAEYRIMIEQHVMQKWSEQLQRDQAEFRGLEKIQRMEQQQQQQQQQQAKAQSSNYLP